MEQNFTIDEGVDTHGVRRQIHAESDAVVLQQTWDAEPHLQYAAEARVQTDGQRWGNGRMIGHMPPVYLNQLLTIKDKDERKVFIANFFQQNPDFRMFHRAFK